MKYIFPSTPWCNARKSTARHNVFSFWRNTSKKTHQFDLFSAYFFFPLGAALLLSPNAHTKTFFVSSFTVTRWGSPLICLYYTHLSHTRPGRNEKAGKVPTLKYLVIKLTNTSLTWNTWNSHCWLFNNKLFVISSLLQLRPVLLTLWLESVLLQPPQVVQVMSVGSHSHTQKASGLWKVTQTHGRKHSHYGNIFIFKKK